jgi:hypothetical protein
MPTCTECGESMEAIAILDDLQVNFLVLRPSGKCEINGYAKERQRWACRQGHMVEAENEDEWTQARRNQRNQ